MITEAKTYKNFSTKPSGLYPRIISGLEIESYLKKINSNWQMTLYE